ncbi:WD40 repeat domain-containing protein [Skeletonema marinoi]|uniref:WD40 repeat domain-containing protein n=1 Tax=Skeletonema marinoi TaxID=267567 RepID=A0AAD8Y4T8_9STRA|nr:WD40 repeat domain-containing protein [Skeletonema marinoi]
MTSADAMEIAPTDGEGSAPEYAALPVYGEHKRAVSSVSFAPPTSQNNNGSSVSSNNAPPGGLATCASASADGTVKIWQVDTTIGRTDTAADMKSSTPLTARSHLQGHTRGINDVCWSPTGEYLATASDDKSLRLYDAIKGETFVEFKGHQNFVFCCKFNPQSNLLVSGSYDETVKLFDVRCGECVMTLPAHSDPVTGVDFSPDGTCICSGSYDGLIRVWDTATGECLKTIYAEGNPAVGNVSFAPNGRYVLGGTLDSKLRLWDVTGRVGVEGENVTNESGQRTELLSIQLPRFATHDLFATADNASTGLATKNTSPFVGALKSFGNASAASIHDEGTSNDSSKDAQAGAARTTSKENFSRGFVTKRVISSSPPPTSSTAINIVVACSPRAERNFFATAIVGAITPTRNCTISSGVLPLYESGSGLSYQLPAAGVNNGTYAPQSVI